MKNLFNIPFILLIIALNISCSKNLEENKKTENFENPEDLYKLAMLDLDSENYDLARSVFVKIENEFPLSNEAIQSQIMLGFIEYVKMDYDRAILKFNRIINRYPSHNNIDYAYYMRAICYYEQIKNEYLDGNFNQKALENQPISLDT